MSLTLSQCSHGQEFTISQINGSGEVPKRLSDLGFTPGTKGLVIRRAPFRGPLQISIRGYSLSLRASEAHLVEIEEISDKGVKNA